MGKRLGKIFRPAYMVFFVMMVCFSVASFLIEQYWLGLAELGGTVLLVAVYAAGLRFRERKLRQYLQSLPNTMENTSSGEGPLPAALVRLGDDTILWHNHRFAQITDLKEGSAEPILSDAFPNLTTDWVTAGKPEFPGDVERNGRRYRVYGTSFRADDAKGTRLAALYFSEMTELYRIRDEYIRSRPVVSIILIDNYEELTKNLTEGATSILNARLNETISKWTEDYHGLFRKMERNRFLFIFEKRELARAVEDKFSLLESVHEIVNPSGLQATISMGLGVDGVNFEEAYNFAALGIEMALSRGGDQAVIKTRADFQFFGGRGKEADYTSKVRSRVAANALAELINQSGYVFIMGHRNADLDALGAAMGVACLCRKKGKRFSIVLDREQNACEKLLAEIDQVAEYHNVFVTGQDALVMCDNRSVLIVVDTNRPEQVECKPLLEAINKVCVIDHHRRAADYINPVMVNLHETYASSASELVTEILSYAVDNGDILPIEAKSLLAGICLDTKFFNVRTGERTFEAAAMLRRLGADTTQVKVLMQSDFQHTLAKYQIIQSAKLYRNEIAIAALEQTTTRVMAAQAADELLNISGISASFVLYPDGEQVIISARSIGSANVQMILEPLGGGGNTATAGAQMQNTAMEQALERLVASIDDYFKE